MRRILPALAATILVLWGCGNGDDLPAAYRAIAVPERFSAPETRRNGRQLYLKNCALCHGERADGRGVRHNALSTKPVDFTQTSWCRAATPREVFYVIREGVDGTAMPAWKALDEEACWDLVAYLLSVCDQGP